MKEYYQCVTGNGTELWVGTATYFGAAMAVFGANGATHTGSGPDGWVHYTGGRVQKTTLQDRAEQTCAEVADNFGTKLPVVAVEVEGYAIDARGDIVLESELDSESKIEHTYARPRYALFLVFRGAGRECMCDFFGREGAETAREEMVTWFGLDAPEPPLEDT